MSWWLVSRSPDKTQVLLERVIDSPLVAIHQRDFARALEGVELLALLRIKYIVNSSLKS